MKTLAQAGLSHNKLIRFLEWLMVKQRLPERREALNLAIGVIRREEARGAERKERADRLVRAHVAITNLRADIMAFEQRATSAEAISREWAYRAEREGEKAKTAEDKLAAVEAKVKRLEALWEMHSAELRGMI